VKLSPDGRYLTLLRNRANDRERYDLWGYDRQKGEWRMLVDSEKLSSGRALSEAEKMQRERQRIGDLKGIVTYSWSADGKSVLVPLDGDLLLAGLDGSVRKVEGRGRRAQPAAQPQGRLCFLCARPSFLGGAGAGRRGAQPDPVEASQTVHWGEAEFVAQEEMARLTGAWWSPDDAHVAVQRFDEAKVGVVTRAAIGATGTKTFDQRYPAAGTSNSEVALYVVSPNGGVDNQKGPVKVDLGTDPDIYLARVDWAPDGKTLYVQRQNRAQTRLDMLRVDPATGKSQVLFTETARDKSWINLTDNYRFLRDGSLIWWSERDGFGHLYRLTGNKWQQLTKGRWMVTSLDGVDEKGGKLYFSGTKDDVLAHQVYSLDFHAKGAQPKLLTDLAYMNSASMDRSGQTLVVTRSAQNQPAQTYLADGTGKRIAWVEENKVDGAHPYAPFMAAHRAHFRHDQGQGWHRPPLEDDHPGDGAGQALSGVL
jgi:dipeptidyl-peptidase-4